MFNTLFQTCDMSDDMLQISMLFPENVAVFFRIVVLNKICATLPNTPELRHSLLPPFLEVTCSVVRKDEIMAIEWRLMSRLIHD